MDLILRDTKKLIFSYLVFSFCFCYPKTVASLIVMVTDTAEDL